jgi:hypothetical protein
MLTCLQENDSHHEPLAVRDGAAAALAVHAGRSALMPTLTFLL